MALEETLAESVAASPIAMVVTNPHKSDNPIEFANDAFCALTGYSKSEIIGRNCRFLAGEATEPTIQAEIRSAVADQRPVLVEMTNYRRDGSAFRNGVMIAPRRAAVAGSAKRMMPRIAVPTAPMPVHIA